MRFELELCRGSVPDDGAMGATEPARKAVREATDRLIGDALLVNDLPELVRLSGEAMLAVAGALLRHGRDPQVPDFVGAARALIEQGRTVMDRGLLLRDWPMVDGGSVMIEVAVRGICAALSVPYDAVLIEVHRARGAGENPAVRRILSEAGLLTEGADDEAGNTDGAGGDS